MWRMEIDPYNLLCTLFDGISLHLLIYFIYSAFKQIVENFAQYQDGQLDPEQQRVIRKPI